MRYFGRKRQVLFALAPSLLLCLLLLFVRSFPVAADSDVRLLYNNYIYYTTTDAGEIIIQDARASITEAEIPAEIDGCPVTEIASYAFKDCTRLTSVTIPDSVLTIGDFAFKDCTSLTELTIPDTVSSIGWGIVQGTPWLAAQTDDFVIVGDGFLLAYIGTAEVVCVPNTVKQITGYAFSSCTTVREVTLPDSVTTLGDFAFDQCLYLQTITLSDRLLSIGSYAFHWCKSLETITLPNSVTSVGDHAFSYCKSLRTIQLSASMQTIENMTFSCCTALTDVEIPEGVLFINSYAFQNCTALAQITLPNSLTELNLGAFEGCQSLEQITIQNASCMIADDADSIPDNTLIYGDVISTAHIYAERYGHDFVALDRLRGDFDGDGEIALNDAYAVLLVYAQSSAGQEVDLTIAERYASDYDENDTIDIQDASKILEYYAKCAAGVI